MRGHWVVVAAAEHVARGRAGGFVQACHGRAAPLRRMRPGDVVACYSPTGRFRGADRLQEFTAIGVAAAGEPYRAEMDGFTPFRRDVAWRAAAPAPMAPLVGRLSFTMSRNWGHALRFGLLAVTADDMRLIADALGAAPIESEVQEPEVPGGGARGGGAPSQTDLRTAG